MTVVVDASVVVAALVDAGPTGSWAESVLASGPLAAPHLMPVEVANVLRRAALSRELTSDAASLAHHDLTSLRVELFPYDGFARRGCRPGRDAGCDTRHPRRETPSCHRTAL